MIGNTSSLNQCQGKGGDFQRKYYLTLTRPLYDIMVDGDSTFGCLPWLL